MIIPIYRNHKFKEGEIIVSTKDIITPYCIFTPNHEFIIEHIKKPNESHHKIVDNEQGLIIKIHSFDNFTLKSTIKESINRNISLVNKDKLYKFIKTNCPNKYEGYDYRERDEYDACKIKNKSSYGSICQVKCECIRHIDKDVINNNPLIIGILRTMKIKNLKKNINETI